MDLRKLKTLIELVESSGISELEVTEGEEKVRIVKSGAAPSRQSDDGGRAGGAGIGLGRARRGFGGALGAR